MGHPFFKNLKIFSIYVGMWILIFGIHFSVLWLNYQIHIKQALFDSFISNALFGLIGLSLWIPLKFYMPSKSKNLSLFLNLLTALCLVILIWISILIYVLEANSSVLPYHDFLILSIPSRIITGVFYYLIIVLIYYLIGYYNDLQEKLQTEILLKEKVKEAELNMLKSQINPHFLFNSLNSISYLTISDPEKAQEMVIKLSDFMRYSVSQSAHEVTSLKSEIENIKRYLEIEQVRFGKKLTFELEIKDQCLENQIPGMILQPLFENAVKHGVYDSLEPITIQTFCKCDRNFLYITIINNIDKDQIQKKGNGIGLKNITERLKLTYQTDGLIQTRKTETTFEVQLMIPQLQNQIK